MHPGYRRGFLGALSGVGAWLVPAWGCPACLSAFAGTMSALGLGFVATSAVLTPLTALLLGAALLSLALGAWRRGGYAPLLVGAAGAVLLGVSKLWPDAPGVAYAGLVALLGACLWNARLTAAPRSAGAPATRSVSRG